ncbi:MAG: D-aminoacyl-tRNA deacylase [Galactobacter sp.]
MRAVVQVADGAHVTVDGEELPNEQSGPVVTGGFDGQGLVVLLGVTHSDDEATAAKVASKIANLRILPDEVSALTAQAPILLISQFTLYGDVRKGRRPGWTQAAPGPVSEPLYEEVASLLRGMGLSVSTGVFGAHMRVNLTNNGPFTILIDSADLPG